MNLTIRRRMVCTFVLSVACIGACADEPAQADAGTRLAVSQTDFILHIAKPFPCTAVAIMQALGTEPAVKGTLLLDKIPTPETISRLILALPSVADLRGALMALRNPYSGQAFFIDAEWVASLKPDNSIVLTFRTQWVARDGSPLSPPHLIEPNATLLISEKEIRFMPSSGKLPITASIGGNGL